MYQLSHGLWRVRRALTVAGSDSGGGAGIQADLKTFSSYGLHGMSAITCITAQNTEKVAAIHVVPAEIVREQIRVVVDDIGVDAVKTGMLYSADIIEAVSYELRRVEAPIVVDPVAVAKSGARLLTERAVKTLIERLVPIATVVTPNAYEAELLTGQQISDFDGQVRAAKALSEMGAQAVVVKGGHLAGDSVVDVLYYRGRVVSLEAQRIQTRDTHGTGCVFASAIAAGLAKGYNVVEAVEMAKKFVTESIAHALRLGRGHGPVHPTGATYENSERFKVLSSLRRAVQLLTSSDKVARLIPESQSNIAMAIEGAAGLEDVAALPGRMVRVGEYVKPVMEPWFGCSRHVASAVLTVLKHDPKMRSAMNIRYGEDILEAAERLGLVISSYDRRAEPEEIKHVEGMTIPWGVEQAVKGLGAVPDIIYHTGDVGKEAMTLVFGVDAVDVALKVLKIADKVGEKNNILKEASSDDM
ncbi:Hydroxymethylpyrimidine/phosphomethylpyrimidine kinase [archaeon HR01]|nr:Hydroxymethylpyrimidine/phosphomethylpyrimidine kinase [archaeon HR01]